MGRRKFYSNNSFQDAEEKWERNRHPDVPVNKVNFGLGEYINTDIHTFLTGSRPRLDGDIRYDTPSHALADLTPFGK